MNEDPFVEYDGAYVLGALSVDDREAFEVHLIECADCRARVAELADLPELLSLVGADAYQTAPARPDPVVVLLEVVRARRVRRRWITAAAATAAAALVISGTALLAGNHTTPARSPAAAVPAPQLTMSAVATAQIHATLAVTDVAWGTSIRLTCTYDEGITYPPDEQYSLVVHGRAGQTENLGSWALVAGKVTTFPAGTALHKSDIASISVDTANGTPLLQVDY